MTGSRDSSIGIATRLWGWATEELGFNSRLKGPTEPLANGYPGLYHRL